MDRGIAPAESHGVQLSQYFTAILPPFSSFSYSHFFYPRIMSPVNPCVHLKLLLVLLILVILFSSPPLHGSILNASHSKHYCIKSLKWKRLESSRFRPKEHSFSSDSCDLFASLISLF